MAALRASVGRETAHEVIKENAVAVALNMRENGGDQDLLERLAADERLPMSKEQLEDALADKHAFIGAAESDRKSTRLNSSHVAISYAVFCLKKKLRHIHMH